jgi:DNA-binding transcriptional regulator YiaG
MNRDELLALAARRRCLEDLLASGQARRIREQARVTCAEVARTLRVRSTAVDAWEHGRSFPPAGVDLVYLELLEALAAVQEPS